MKLAEVAAPSLAGFGRDTKQIIDEESGKVLCFTAVQNGDGESESKEPEIWIHFPRPLPKKKAKAVMEYLGLRK